MGCGASADKHADERTEPDRRQSNNGKGAGKERDVAYVEESSPPADHLDDNDDHPAITASVMSELRNRSREHPTGGTVQKWIDGITEPGDNDAPDVYDPARRHLLSMESLNLRLNQE